ncbi:unnamed protein product [Macrosiphum euphorbiae]|uniref:SWIM-type domain-containing protein n=1 Tax=Macrosiphum euphorbiae TaxID=13131 RepID=A0AAV0XJ69_9HEMI|nr:unnamed protein product [Macrosiphum euphorbiae]
MVSMKKKIKYLSKENIKEIDDHMFKVPSETGDSMYEVYTDLGCCTCEYGRLGKFCKHQAAIYFYFGKELPNAPHVTAHCRHAMAALAFGNKVQPLSFYTSLNEITQTSEENSSIDTNTEQEGTKTNDNENSINEYKKHEVNSEISDNVVSTHIPLDDSSELNGEEEFKKVINLMTENHSKYGSSTASTQMFLKKLKNVKTRNSWETFLATCGKQISFRLGAKSKIHVQPTSISRRRPEVTRGCKRLAVGRPPSDEKIKKSKRKRNLQHNIGKNQPNAKSH